MHLKIVCVSYTKIQFTKELNREYTVFHFFRRYYFQTAAIFYLKLPLDAYVTHYNIEIGAKRKILIERLREESRIIFPPLWMKQIRNRQNDSIIFVY